MWACLIIVDTKAKFGEIGKSHKFGSFHSTKHFGAFKTGGEEGKCYGVTSWKVSE